ncbi:arginase family protein [Neobacillus sp. D3-1R]|uniref:arginase family protein n=1 Tax=Neobacillus sp. D3-1R TaxID=3445778 RepID=UPI003F9F9185
MNIQIVGIPSQAGALYEGTELAPEAIRAAGLIQKLTEQGFSVKDLGDIISVSSLPRHNIGPVRNWPAPRIVWEELDNRAKELFQNNSFTILLGGDCSLEVGTFHAFQKVFGSDSHLLVLDAHVDTMEPNGDVCIGAAGMGLWFLQQKENRWWKGEAIPSESISIIGPQQNTILNPNLKIISYEESCQPNGLTKVKEHLNSISASSILVHLDVDVLHNSIMPAAYAPSEIGFELPQIVEILTTILADPRVKGIEVTEFSANKDKDQACAQLLVDLLCLLSIKMNQ